MASAGTPRAAGRDSGGRVQLLTQRAQVNRESKRGSEGARERGSEGARERGSEGASERTSKRESDRERKLAQKTTRKRSSAHKSETAELFQVFHREVLFNRVHNTSGKHPSLLPEAH